METIHIVSQGEHIASIAKTYGFSDWKTIYDHPKNKDLKEKRPNPNILYPGDQVFIPKKEFKQKEIQADKKFTVKVKSIVSKLQVVLKGYDDKPLANKKFKLKFDKTELSGSTDDQGKVKHEMPPDARSVELSVVLDDKDPDNTAVWQLKIGDLDPLDEVTGMEARLNNLGYDAGNSHNAEDRQFKSAVEEFQCDHKLKVDGICGPKTQSKLKEVHGC